MRHFFVFIMCVFAVLCLNGCDNYMLDKRNNTSLIESTGAFSIKEDDISSINVQGDDSTSNMDTTNNEYTNRNTVTYDNTDKFLNETLRSNCKIYVNDVELMAENGAYIFSEKNYTVIPIISVFKTLGASVNWESRTTATIEYGSLLLELNATEKNVINKATGTNYYRDPVGMNRMFYFGFNGNDFFLDSTCVYNIFYDSNIKMTIDYNNYIIDITKIKPIPDQEKETNCKLMIDGRDIASNHFVYLNCNEHWCEVPLVALVESIGATVDWDSDTTAWIMYNGKVYYLDTVANSLIKNGSTENLFVKSAYRYNYNRNKGYYGIIRGEYIVDSNSMKMFLLELDVIINIDYTNSIVSICREGDGWSKQGNDSMSSGKTSE